MHDHGKSDRPIVPAKVPNKAGRPVVEALEERGLAKGSTDRPTRPGRSAGPDVPSGLDRVREVARRDKDARFTALLHQVTVARLRAGLSGDTPPGHAGGGRGRPTARIWTPTSGTCTIGSTAAATGHGRLGGRTSCAVRRLVASPAQQGGTWREVSGSTGLPDAERLTEQEHVGWPWPGEGTEGARGRTRVTWQRLDCLKSNLRSVNTRTRRNGVWNRCRVMRWHGM